MIEKDGYIYLNEFANKPIAEIEHKKKYVNSASIARQMHEAACEHQGIPLERGRVSITRNEDGTLSAQSKTQRRDAAGGGWTG